MRERESKAIKVKVNLLAALDAARDSLEDQLKARPVACLVVSELNLSLVGPAHAWSVVRVHPGGLWDQRQVTLNLNMSEITLCYI